MLDSTRTTNLAEAAQLYMTGFATREGAQSNQLKTLAESLLGSCPSDYMRHFLEGGLQHWSRSWEYPYILSQVSKYSLGKGKLSIFDNACGVNAVAYLLATAGHAISGTDLNQQACIEGDYPSDAWNHPDTKDVAGSLQFQEADSLDLPFPDNSFDVSYSISSLEHMPDPVKAIDEMIRVTKPGGLITFTMDVADIDTSVDGEHNVNRATFSRFQAGALQHTTPFSPVVFSLPSTQLNWRTDCFRSTPLPAAAGRVTRTIWGVPEPANFYIFGASLIKTKAEA
jgi:ubiquinone/menaquinone biosynthesis C-methylase UbiE